MAANAMSSFLMMLPLKRSFLEILSRQISVLYLLPKPWDEAGLGSRVSTSKGLHGWLVLSSFYVCPSLRLDPGDYGCNTRRPLSCECLHHLPPYSIVHQCKVDSFSKSLA